MRYNRLHIMANMNKHFTIQEKQGSIQLLYTYKITKKEVVRSNKAKTVNKFYHAFMPPELVEYMQFKDKLYFYKDGKDILITSVEPSIEHRSIKLQKNNQFSIPKTLFNPQDFDYVRLILDFSRVDNYKRGLGVLKMELI